MLAPQVAQLIKDSVAHPTAAVAKKSPRPAIDKVSEQNTVACCHFGTHRISRVPGIISYGTGVAGISREWHLLSPGLLPVRQTLVKNRADVRARIVRRQIELDGASLPQPVGGFESAIAGDVAGQNR